jgi:hypothetical protein
MRPVAELIFVDISVDVSAFELPHLRLLLHQFKQADKSGRLSWQYSASIIIVASSAASLMLFCRFKYRKTKVTKEVLFECRC